MAFVVKVLIVLTFVAFSEANKLTEVSLVNSFLVNWNSDVFQCCLSKRGDKIILSFQFSAVSRVAKIPQYKTSQNDVAAVSFKMAIVQVTIFLFFVAFSGANPYPKGYKNAGNGPTLNAVNFPVEF